MPAVVPEPLSALNNTNTKDNMSKRDDLQTNIKTAKAACKTANEKKLIAIKDYRNAKANHKTARQALDIARKALAAFDNRE